MNNDLRSKKVRWPEAIKNSAKKLRSQGLTYREIINIVGVSRSTLFSWIGGTKRLGYITEEDMKLHMERMRELAARANKHKRVARLEKIAERIKKEIPKYNTDSVDNLRLMLSMLYWAEGTKSRGSLIFTNTDPKLSLLYLTLLRKVYRIDESKLRVRLHLHSYHKVDETRRFWSKLLQIPESKFGKIYVKERSGAKKFRKNFAGICFIKYYSEDLRFEILEVADQIANKIAPMRSVPVA